MTSLDELERLEREATPGPWWVDERGRMRFDDHHETPNYTGSLEDMGECTAAFLLALRNSAADLIAKARRLERLEAEIADRTDRHKSEALRMIRVRENEQSAPPVSAPAGETKVCPKCKGSQCDVHTEVIQLPGGGFTCKNGDPGCWDCSLCHGTGKALPDVTVDGLTAEDLSLARWCALTVSRGYQAADDGTRAAYDLYVKLNAVLGAK